MAGNGHAQQMWVKAELHLAEALAQDPARTPGAIVVASYFAMYQAARAAILRVVGSQPTTPAHVVRQFRILAASRPNTLGQSGYDFRRAHHRRGLANYHLTKRFSADEAQDTLAKAKAFLRVCAREFDSSREPKNTRNG
jgi:uncharacterized protein (UPF0332 family)